MLSLFHFPSLHVYTELCKIVLETAVSAGMETTSHFVMLWELVALMTQAAQTVTPLPEVEKIPV